MNWTVFAGLNAGGRDYWGRFARFNEELVSEFERIRGNDFTLIDGGAAGGLSQPFDQATSALTAIRFEPRGERNVDSAPNEFYVEGALWSEDGRGTLHIAQRESTSSIYPPNLPFLEQFDDNYGVPPRTPVETAAVTLRSVDSCVELGEIVSPNFIKLDVHSSELPALLGSQGSLGSCVGLLIETWNSEVHAGAGLHFQVEEFCIRNGFEVWDLRCAARWLVKHNGKVAAGERARYIGSELLVFRSEVAQHLLLEKSFSLALFGFYSAALNELDRLNSRDSARFRAAVLRARSAVNRGSWVRRLTGKLRNSIDGRLLN